MQQNIHPKWYADAQVVCACGNTFTIGSTKPTIKVEICAKCHPFFTGTMKYVDTLGRVERFQKKQKIADSQATIVAAAKKKKAEKLIEAKHPRTLREMLLELKK
jgi:large subunit ribosomal protein L31